MPEEIHTHQRRFSLIPLIAVAVSVGIAFVMGAISSAWETPTPVYGNGFRGLRFEPSFSCVVIYKKARVESGDETATTPLPLGEATGIEAPDPALERELLGLLKAAHLCMPTTTQETGPRNGVARLPDDHVCRPSLRQKVFEANDMAFIETSLLLTRKVYRIHGSTEATQLAVPYVSPSTCCVSRSMARRAMHESAVNFAKLIVERHKQDNQ